MKSEEEEFKMRCIIMDKELHEVINTHSCRVICSVLASKLVDISRLQKDPDGAFDQLIQGMKDLKDRK
jgi:hypothetical protein